GADHPPGRRDSPPLRRADPSPGIRGGNLPADHGRHRGRLLQTGGEEVMLHEIQDEIRRQVADTAAPAETGAVDPRDDGDGTIRPAAERRLLSGGQIQARGSVEEIYPQIMADTVAGCYRLEGKKSC